MARYNWMLNVALGGWIVAATGFSLPLNAEEHQPKISTEISDNIEQAQGVTTDSPAPQESTDKQTPEELTPAFEHEQPSSTIESKRPAEPACDTLCQEAEQREKDDLKAQEAMASSAEDLVVITWWQFGAGGAGITLLIYTLYLTRNATNAAIEANRIARESAERQLRAYVFVKNSRRTRRKDTDPWVIEAHIKNFGQTPAYHASFRTVVEILDTNDEPTFEFPIPEKANVKLDLAPGHEQTIRKEIPNLTDPTVWGDFKSGQVAVYFWGRIDFIDAFDAPRWIRFRLVNPGGYVLNFYNCREGNETSESA